MEFCFGVDHAIVPLGTELSIRLAMVNRLLSDRYVLQESKIRVRTGILSVQVQSRYDIIDRVTGLILVSNCTEREAELYLLGVIHAIEQAY